MCNFINKNLIADEKVLYRTKKHIIIFMIPLFLTLITLFFFLNANPYLVKASYIGGIITALSWLNQFLLYVVSEFAITDKRIMMREGFFYRHTNETRLSAIANVGVNQSLLAQLLNYGTVFINTFGGETDKFTELTTPLIFQKKLQELLYSAATPPPK
ncbi:MAG: hypothetical protein K0S27_424 [Gammaproteobacteria bacterium]|jgi:uncharacterized membrane protein YdbT with pleckstrin-like domain|nr:hypothetical protein [Gammaproteobacteria bacterium]